MLTATQAAKMTEESLNGLIEKFRQTIERHISRAASEGVSFVTVKYDLPLPPDGFVEELEDLGYHVEMSKKSDELQIEWT